MALINAFDSGPCSLVISTFNNPNVHTGYLAKGQTTGVIPGANPGGEEMIQLTVTTEGQIELYHVSGSETSGYQVDVVPDATFHGGAVQGISLPELAPDPSYVGDGGDSGDLLTYSGDSGAVTPDPASLPDAVVSVGVFAGRFT